MQNNKLTFDGNAYRIELSSGVVYEGSTTNLIAHFAVDTITICDRATKLHIPIMSSRANILEINGEVKTFEQAQVAIEDALSSAGGASSADKVSYDNTTSGLQSTNVQGAIDEIGANLGELDTQVQGHETALHNIPTLTESDWETLRTAGGVQSEIVDLQGTIGMVIPIASLTECLYDGLGKWYNTANYSNQYYPVKKGWNITIKMSNVAGAISFVKEIGASGTNVEYAQGSSRVEYGANSIVVLTAQEDSLLLLPKKQGSNDATPLSVIVNSQFVRVDSARNFSLNPFEGKPFIHHLGVEQGKLYYVQSQSLYDIHLANALGARVIEANCHRTLDGVYLVKHGQSGKLGYGLMFLDGATFDQNALFSELTYEQIKTYVRYTHNDNAPQYGGTIPTLEEFCQEANIFGLSVLINCPDRDCLNVARKKLQDERIICYGSLERGDFKGVMCEYYDATTAQQVITRAQKIGLPYLFSWRNFFSIEQSTRKEIISQLHAKGILVGSSYGGVESNIISLKDGVDCVSSTYASINVPSNGNDVTIANVNDSRLTLNNATYNSTDKTIDITSGGSVMVIDNNFAKCCGAANLRIRYSGTLSIWMGYGNQWTAKNTMYAIVDKTSDGAELVTMAQMTMSNYILRIVASEDTKIYDLCFSASIAM